MALACRPRRFEAGGGGWGRIATTACLAALGLLTLSPASSAADRRPRDPDRPASDPVARKRAPMAAPSVAAALERKRADIEVTVIGDIEDSVPGGTNVLELGEVSYRPDTGADSGSAGRGGQRATILRRSVTVRIGTARTGFAPLRASLQGGDGRCRIRVDGKTLTAAAQVIDPLAPLGQPVPHVIEIEIDKETAAGPISASIAWTSDAQ